MKCAVHNCTNKFKKKQKHSEQLSFFQFPKNDDILKKWISFCRKSSRDKLKVTTNTVICNEHFKEDDIQGALQFQMGLCSKRTLRPGAVPCINKNNLSLVERELSEKRKNKRLVDELLEEAATREAAEASGEIVVAPDFIRNTGINSAPDFVSATGNAFFPFTPATGENDPLAEEHIDQLDLCTKSSSTTSEKHDERIKCRTCHALFVFNDNCKDLGDKQNAVMLYHIEVITGIWIQCVDGQSAVMCSVCVHSLQTAIDFRETCIQTELQLSEAANNDIPNIINEDWDDQPDSQQELASESDIKGEFVSVVTTSDPNGQTTAIEPLSLETIQQIERPIAPTAADPHSLALGAQIYEDLLKEYKGEDKTPRIRQKNVMGSRHKLAKQRKGKTVEHSQAKQPKRTKEEKNRMRRERIRSLPLNHVCDQCGASFRVRCNLTIHMLRHTRTKNYTCSECPKKFYDSYMRNMHVRVKHRGELPFTCNYCKKAFRSSNTRYLHEKNVHAASPRIHRNQTRLNRQLELKGKCQDSSDIQRENIRYMCSLCDKSYATKYALNSHMNHHTGAMPYKCKLCDMRFHSPQARKKHEMQHDSKRPFECDICLKGFFVRSKLKEHERIHTGERPYRCDICNALFRYKFNLYSHQFSKMHKENLQKAVKLETNEESN